MLLKLDQAYFNPPERRSVKDHVGLESVRYRYDAKQSLRLLDQSTLPSRPAKQLAAAVLPAAQLRARHHRLIFQVAHDRESGAARAVLLSASSPSALAKRHEALRRTAQCTFIPEAASATCSSSPEAPHQPTSAVQIAPANSCAKAPPSTSTGLSACPLMPGDELSY